MCIDLMYKEVDELRNNIKNIQILISWIHDKAWYPKIDNKPFRGVSIQIQWWSSYFFKIVIIGMLL